MLSAAIMLMAHSAAATPAAAPRRVIVGIEVQADSAEAARRIHEGFAVALAADATADFEVRDGCGDVAFCVSAVVVPIRLGKREGGWAVAAHVSRRLLVHPNWPWKALPPEAPEGASPIRIQDAFTAGGDVGCAPCQRDLERLQREVADARRVADPTMVDEGDLQLVLGPGSPGFLSSAAENLAQGLVARHVKPWLASGGDGAAP